MVIFAYGAAMAAGDWTRASMYLNFLQSFWTEVGLDVKQYAISQGATMAAVNLIPDTLNVDGAFSLNTAKVVEASLLLNFGSAAAPLIGTTPTGAGGVALWFQTKVAPLAPPTSGAWALWNATKDSTSAALTNNVISQKALAYWTGGIDAMNTVANEIQPTPGVPPQPVAPVPGGLPTITPHGGDVITVTGGSTKTPGWVKFLGVAVLVGAVAGVGWYVVKKRPDLFRSRSKGR